MKALWVHREIFGKRWWIAIPMKAIDESVPVKNALFEAMLGRDPGQMPEAMDAFFSQRKDASSTEEVLRRSNRVSAYIKGAILNIAKK
jgi:hypothetical protein